MLRSLHVAATGMAAEEAQLDAISNNLSNSNTVGFKKVRADFQDLMYQTVRAAGTQSTATTQLPTGLQVGTGVRMVSTTRLQGQGSIQQTNNPLDLAIQGNGFFVVQQADGTPAYTRDGSLKTDAQGRVVTSDGSPLEPPISIPANALNVTIGADGTVSVTTQGQTTPTQVGQIQIANFVNPAGLSASGQNLFTATAASGDPQVGNPGTDGRGSVQQGSIEQSNVDVVEEMVGLISAQRAYEIDTKVVSAADQMLQSVTQLR
jgi:flagellar basal-body rod protein FlgG